MGWLALSRFQDMDSTTQSYLLARGVKDIIINTRCITLITATASAGGSCYIHTIGNEKIYVRDSLEDVLGAIIGVETLA